MFKNYRTIYGSFDVWYTISNYYLHSLFFVFPNYLWMCRGKNWVKSLVIYFKSIHFILVSPEQRAVLTHSVSWLSLVHGSETVINITLAGCPGVIRSEGLILGLDYSIGNKRLNWQLMCVRSFRNEWMGCMWTPRLRHWDQRELSLRIWW